jgi:hypothetical protein
VADPGVDVVAAGGEGVDAEGGAPGGPGAEVGAVGAGGGGRVGGEEGGGQPEEGIGLGRPGQPVECRGVDRQAGGGGGRRQSHKLGHPAESAVPVRQDR